MNTYHLIYRVLSGDASKEEQERLARWLALNEANSSEYEDVKLLWEYSADRGGGALPDNEYRDCWNQIEKQIAASQQRRKRRRLIIVILIIVLILEIIGWLAYNLGRQELPSLHSIDGEIGEIGEIREIVLYGEILLAWCSAI
jgi:ferric-dicitrate binding protein FerR (iron transport regulator)